MCSDHGFGEDAGGHGRHHGRFNPWYANWAQEQVAQGKVPTMEDGAKAYLESEEVQKKIADAIMGSIDMKQATEALQTQLQQQLVGKMQQAVPAMAQALESQLQASITTAMTRTCKTCWARTCSRCRPRWKRRCPLPCSSP